MMTLTIQEVKSAKNRAKPYKLADSRGLYLLVSPAGNKIWRFKYRFGQLEKLLTLGRYPELGLVTARELADGARRLIRSGKDPAVEARNEKMRRADAAKVTFRKVSEEWLTDQEPVWSLSNAKRVRNRFERDLYPMFGSVPIASLESTTILRALRKIEARGSIETAKRVRGYVEAVFKRARGERLVEGAVLLEIEEIRDALKPGRPGSRHPALTTFPELLDLQLCVDRSTSKPITKLASRFAALTVVRVGVIRTATWSEFHGIDWDDPTVPCEKPIWKISATRMKLEVEDKLNPAFGHEVPLATQAVEVLRAVRVLTGHCQYLFPLARAWRYPMTDAALSTMYKRMAGEKFKGRMVPHGWRSSFSTLLNERAAELERDGDRMLIDMILAHVPAGISASEWAYNRARYLKPRAALLQVWADLVTAGLPSPSTLLLQPDGDDNAGRMVA
jgi:integrase